jgi:hypothetical protein
MVSGLVLGNVFQGSVCRLHYRYGKLQGREYQRVDS